VYRALVLPALLMFAAAFFPQQPSSNAPATQRTPSYEGIPVTAAKQANPVAASPESLARAKRWWTMDCEMCHGKSGDGKGDTAKDMKLTMADFTNPDTLKERTDGEIFYIIKNGHNDMPAEGERVKTDETWDLVNYVRALSKKNGETKGQ
jgi:mono/diheme cytochrome c family protein